MREIKFRAWDKRYKRMELVWNMNWVTNSKAEGVPKGSVSHIHTKSDFQGSSKLTSPERDSCYGGASTNYVLMQYTGLKDRNGKEIYEGDVLGMTTTHMTMHGGVGLETHRYYVKDIRNLDKIKLGFNKNGDAIKLINGGGWVILGNIYENPELLEK